MDRVIGHISDLHLSFKGTSHKRDMKLLRHDARGCDLVVLCGDICGFRDVGKVMEHLSSFPCPVVFVAGNHEFYGTTRDHGLDIMRREARKNGVVFLENETAVVNGTRIAGTTGWWDGSAFRFHPEDTKLLNDFAPPVGIFDIHVHDRGFAWGNAARRFLENALLPGEPTVVVTHTAPLPACIPAKWSGKAGNVFFANDWSHLFDHVPLWLHGHTHHPVDFMAFGTRVASNPCHDGKRSFSKVALSC